MSSNNSSSNRINVPEARQAMDQFKMRSANEVGVNLKNGGGACPEGGIHSCNHDLSDILSSAYRI